MGFEIANFDVFPSCTRAPALKQASVLIMKLCEPPVHQDMEKRGQDLRNPVVAKWALLQSLLQQAERYVRAWYELNETLNHHMLWPRAKDVAAEPEVMPKSAVESSRECWVLRGLR